MLVKVCRVREGAAIPAYATPGAAGMDLSAVLQEPLALKPGSSAKIPTGIALELPGLFSVTVKVHRIQMIRGCVIVSAEPMIESVSIRLREIFIYPRWSSTFD